MMPHLNCEEIVREVYLRLEDAMVGSALEMLSSDSDEELQPQKVKKEKTPNRKPPADDAQDKEKRKKERARTNIQTKTKQ